MKIPLRSVYPDLREFFRGIDVPDSLAIQDLAQLLKQLSDKGSPTPVELDTIFRIYHEINSYIEKNGGEDSSWLRELLQHGVLWTNKDEFWRNDGDLFLNDNLRFMNCLPTAREWHSSICQASKP